MQAGLWMVAGLAYKHSCCVEEVLVLLYGVGYSVQHYGVMHRLIGAHLHTPAGVYTNYSSACRTAAQAGWK